MNMAISDNLFLAILSMDAYNRDYFAAVKVPPASSNVTALNVTGEALPGVRRRCIASTGGIDAA
jgi:hypothetical protein